MSAGYIQLDLGGKKRGVKLGNYALLEYSRLNGTGVIEFNDENPIKLCSDLVYCGLKNNAYIKKEIVDFTLDDVIIWVDDMPIQQINDIIDLFQNSIKASNSVIEIQQAMDDEKASKSSKPKK